MSLGEGMESNYGKYLAILSDEWRSSGDIAREAEKKLGISYAVAIGYITKSIKDGVLEKRGSRVKRDVRLVPLPENAAEMIREAARNG